jgi:hypothetical protein
MTYKQAQRLVRNLGLVLSRSDYNEYVVNFRHGREATAYFTNDLNDALSTAMVMARSLTNPRLAAPVSMQPAYYKMNPGKWHAYCWVCLGGGKALTGPVSKKDANSAAVSHLNQYGHSTSVLEFKKR